MKKAFQITFSVEAVANIIIAIEETANQMGGPLMPGNLKYVINGNVNFALFITNLLVIVPSIKQKVDCKN